ncbi:MAG: hypothetical protein HZA66_18865 [Rhodopseudomonas palustris]|uniref:Uncharacterized protein n=1 Tax=Rhodopseudomonas palustris TaxID=1076 RepID=A0A933S1T2_RHOPL|nr:hypothetical protein [Rhodopseudomonas palustris]
MPFPDAFADHPAFVLRTPSGLDEVVADFCLSLGACAASETPVAPTAEAEAGRPDGNVAIRIARDGGTALTGWTIEACPLFLSARFHVAWVPPDGVPTDVTPRADGAAVSLFAPDSRYAPTFHFARRPEDRTRRLVATAPERARLALSQLPASRRLYEEKRAAAKGIDPTTWIAMRLPPSPLEQDVDALLTCMAMRDRLLHHRADCGTQRDRRATDKLEERIAMLRTRIASSWRKEA